MGKAELGKVGKLVLDALKRSKRPLSTYEVAKLLNISWSTANTHCYIMKSLGIVDSKNEETKVGMKRMVWWAK